MVPWNIFCKNILPTKLWFYCISFFAPSLIRWNFNFIVLCLIQWNHHIIFFIFICHSKQFNRIMILMLFSLALLNRGKKIMFLWQHRKIIFSLCSSKIKKDDTTKFILRSQQNHISIVWSFLFLKKQTNSWFFCGCIYNKITISFTKKGGRRRGCQEGGVWGRGKDGEFWNGGRIVFSLGDRGQ